MIILNHPTSIMADVIGIHPELATHVGFKRQPEMDSINCFRCTTKIFMARASLAFHFTPSNSPTSCNVLIDT